MLWCRTITQSTQLLDGCPAIRPSTFPFTQTTLAPKRPLRLEDLQAR
jgi:hypothetical protein